MVRDMEDVMFGRPELLFKCKFRPYGAKKEDNLDFELPLVFFSAFERTNLTPDNPMQRQEAVIQLYEPGPWPYKKPVLHVGLVVNVLCRAPLMPCFIGGNETATVPQSLRRYHGTRFPHGRADTQPGKGDGSKLYEVNMWMWTFGRHGGIPRTVTVDEAERMRSMAKSLAMEKRWQTRKRNRDMRTASGH